MSTFVLLHGAWHDSTCWDQVRTRLESQGHQVIAPSLQQNPHQQGIRGWSRQVCAILATLVDPVILVGHSLGGYVASHVADRLPERVLARCYLDSFLPAPGMQWYLGTTVAGMRGYAQCQDPELRAWWQRALHDFWRGKPLPVSPPSFLGLDLAIPEQRRVYETLLPCHSSLHDLTLRFALPRQPVSYLHCRHTAIPGLFAPFARYAASRAAHDPHWTYGELEAPHDAQVTHPDDVAAALLAIAASPEHATAELRF